MEAPTFNISSFELLASHLIRRNSCVNKEEEYCTVLLEYLESSRKERDECQKEIEALQQKIEAFKRQHTLLLATRDRLERSVFVERQKAVLEKKEKEGRKQKEKELKHKIQAMKERYNNTFELLKAKYPEELCGERETAVSRVRSLRVDRDELRRRLDKLKLTLPVDSANTGWNLWKEHVIRVAELLKPKPVLQPFTKRFLPIAEEVVTKVRKNTSEPTSPSPKRKDPLNFKRGKQVTAEVETYKAKLDVPVIDKPMSFTRPNVAHAAQKSTPVSTLKIKTFHFPQLKMPCFKTLKKNVSRAEETPSQPEDRASAVARPPPSSPGFQMSMQSSSRSQEVDVGSRTRSQEVDVGSQTRSQEVDLGSRTPSQEVDLSSRTCSQEVDLSSQTLSQEVDLSFRTRSQEVDVGSRTRSQNLDMGSLTRSQELYLSSRTRSQEFDIVSRKRSQEFDVGFQTRLQEPSELNESHRLTRDTEGKETLENKSLEKDSQSEISRVGASAVRTSTLSWSPTWEKRRPRALGGQKEKSPFEAQTKESSVTPSPPSRKTDSTPPMGIEPDQTVNQAHSEDEGVTYTSYNPIATANPNDSPVPMDIDPSPIEGGNGKEGFLNPTHQLGSEESRDGGHSSANASLSMVETIRKIPRKNERHAYVRSLLQSPCFSFSPSVDQSKSGKRSEEPEKSGKQAGMERDDQDPAPSGFTKTESVVSTQPAEGTSQGLPINTSQQDSNFGSDGTGSQIHQEEDDPYFNVDTYTPTINTSPEVPTFSFSLFDPQNDFSPLPADGGVRSLFGSPKNNDDPASAPTASSLFPSGESNQIAASFNFNYDMGGGGTPPDKRSSTSGGSFFSMFSGANSDQEAGSASSQPFFKLF